ncbi:filamentous hemagglutinin N-terminal domain-containing protein [Geminocystis sp. NIES-3709]|uniref:two-partner secretion domain-containing protein n=1 Tax=Geminocystis sp. NIES-3709 TaxID=1617448 RepID=UPI0005FCCB86|nr:filamentous hemagglutinin N-terminal domain-containing protein [Geminocystis sp. NIES-3709]BAQ65241.1 putative hemagglutinin-related protein [Geminocystis sp. NIES-3709]
MKNNLLKIFFPSLLFCYSLSFLNNDVLAQLIPDNTLGNENSTVRQLNSLKQLIEGGALRGKNLFHSFLEFNVNNGQRVYFTNPQGVNNILTRVTGDNISQILGVLGVNGNANLFLLNPNGFIFGNNASLDLNGSFIGTTGDIKLGKNGLFSATNIQGSTLLDIAPEVIFTNAQNKIENRANLVVKDGKNLLLIAQEVIDKTPENQLNSILALKNERLKADNSLGSENTQIETIDTKNDRVVGGAKRDINLFHSFEEFNIERGKGVYFANPVGVQNILARVTGKNLSEIRGILGVEGNADLYLINPNGLFFNQNARLDLNGSFFVSTAEAIVFDNFEYSTKNPNTPPNVLLDVPLGFRFNNNPADIILKNEALDNQNDVVTENAEVGDLPDNSQSVNNNETPPPLTIEGTLNQESDTDTYQVFLTEGSNFDVTTEGTTNFDTRLFLFDSQGKGIIANDDINQDNRQSTLPRYQVNESGNYYLSITSSFNSPKNSQGNIFGNETTEISPDVIIPEGFLIDENPIGLGGNSPVTAWTNFGLESGSYVIKLNGGLVENGNLGVNAGKTLGFIGGNVVVDGISINSSDSNIILGGVKEASTIIINPNKTVTFPTGVSLGNISLVNQGRINVQGNRGGRVNLVGNQINLDNSSILGGINANNSYISSSLDNINLKAIEHINLNNSTIEQILSVQGKGNVGGINLIADSISLTNNSRINTTLRGEGSIESINIDSNNLTLDQFSLISNIIGIDAQGNNQGITINTDNLNLNNNSGILTAVGIEEILEINQLKSPNGNISNKVASGEGTTGKIDVLARGDINLDNGSLIANIVVNNARANSGGINIETENLSLANSSQINAGSGGFGNAGKINILAHNSINLDGTNPNTDVYFSNIASTVENGGKGNSEGIEITTKTLHLLNGGRISTSVSGDNLNVLTEGNAGLVKINALEKVIIEGQNKSGFTSFIDSTINGNVIGDSQGISIDTNNLILRHSGSIITSSNGKGDAGLIKINVNDNLIINGDTKDSNAFRSSILSTMETGGKGNSQGVEINANNLRLINGGRIGSSVITDNRQMLTRGNAGLIKINTTSNISLQGQNSQTTAPSIIDSVIGFGSVGNSKGVEINTSNLSLKDGANIITSTSGEGNAGKILINAQKDITLDGANTSNNQLITAIVSTVENGAKGNSEGININTPSLNVLNGSRISTSVIGNNPENPTIGNTGLIKIKADNSLTLRGKNEDNSPSIIDSFILSNSIGDSRGIEIETGKLTIQNLGTISSSSFGNGDAGKIIIKADDGITIEGENVSNSEFQSGIFSTLESGAKGDSQGIDIDTTFLNIINGGRITASTFGEDINTITQGNTGLVKINASQEIFLDGGNNKNIANSIDSLVGEFVIGDSQGIEINTPTLTVKNGGNISANTLGEGNAGAIKVTADTILLTGEKIFEVDGKRITLPSNISSPIEGKKSKIYRSGGIIINTHNFIISDGGTIASSTDGTGDAGQIKIKATESIILSGRSKGLNIGNIDSSIFPFAEGNSDGIVIQTPLLILKDFGSINASTKGSGNGGIINITTETPLILTNHSEITSALDEGGVGKGGNIIINAPSLILDDQSQINASTAGIGEGGFVQLFIDDTIHLNNGSQIATAVEKTGIGLGGRIAINTQTLNLDNQSQLRASTLGQGNADSILVNADNITLTNDSRINTETESNFKAGNITLNVAENLFISGSGLFANTQANSNGDGGNIIINSPFINLSKQGSIAVNSLGNGKGGDISINVNSLNLDNADITTQTLSSDGGNLSLKIQDLLTLRNGSNITATAGTSQGGGEGDGGNIMINSPLIISYPSNPLNGITANAFEGKGGNIDITTNVILGGEFLIISASSQLGVDGEVIIRNPNIDPTSGLISLDSNFVDIEGLINQNPCKLIDNKLSGSFYIIGKGGLPAQPSDFNYQNIILTPWLNLEEEDNSSNVNLSFPNISLKPFVSFACNNN